MANQNQRRVATRPPRGKSSQLNTRAAAAAAKVTPGTARTTSGATRADRPAGPASPPSASTWTPAWIRWATLALSLIGLGLSIYLTVAHLAGAHVLACSNKGTVNCELVTPSPESEVFGIFPVAELGLAFYVGMTFLNLPWAWRPVWTWLPKRGPLSKPQVPQRLPVLAWQLRLASVIVGVLFILYLVYTELITLRAICLWCTYVHITTFLLFAALLTQATFWGSPAKAQPKAP
jgi:uncharacterized membrane protein